ncbi:unnamed protein product [Dibothriocephalus latus]|uniref:Uncharacterized protein n=1 Tax=Dibothriocephalus latus TaxID=60516 RepID=A0A3P7NGP7_DIBLA|nr:unnamed protein product [Dibothriocephalus latus]
MATKREHNIHIKKAVMFKLTHRGWQLKQPDFVKRLIRSKFDYPEVQNPLQEASNFTMMAVKDAYGLQVAHCLKKCNCQRRKASSLKFVRHVWRAVHRIWRLFMRLVAALRAFVVRVVFIGITIAIICLLPLLLDLHIATQAYLDPESFSGSVEKW